MQAAKAAMNFKTTRNSMLPGNTKGLPTLTTVEQVHVYNSSSIRSPIHLNNIMISVKRKLDEPITPNPKKTSKLNNFDPQKFGNITSLQFGPSRNSVAVTGEHSPSFSSNRNPSLTHRSFANKTHMPAIPRHGAPYTK